jgi:hypothetical protein
MPIRPPTSRSRASALVLLPAVNLRGGACRATVPGASWERRDAFDAGRDGRRDYQRSKFPFVQLSTPLAGFRRERTHREKASGDNGSMADVGLQHFFRPAIP